MNVLVLYSVFPDSVVAVDRVAGEFALTEAAECVAAALPGASAVGVVGALDEVLGAIRSHRPDVVFNACEAPLGRPDRETHVAALLEWMGIRFTGAGSETLALCRRKDWVKPLLAAAGIAVPRDGGFPCIVKPADEDGSYGIWTGSICENTADVARARSHLTGPVLVEEFLPGREFVVSLWGERAPDHVSIGETEFQGGIRLITYAGKWRVDSVDFRDTPLTYDPDIAPDLRDAIVAAARGAWRVVGARGYLRVDVRLGADGRPRVLDVNPNSELTPGVGMHRAVVEAGWNWVDFVRNLVEWAC
jgi:D-alanine-D-alanine ligase